MERPNRKAKIINGIQAVIACVAVMFQSDDPWPIWKMNTTIPKAAPSEMRLRIAALIGSTIERKARVSRTSVRMSTNASTYGKLP